LEERRSHHPAGFLTDTPTATGRFRLRALRSGTLARGHTAPESSRAQPKEEHTMTTFTVDRQRFGIETDPRTGAPYVHSIHPYDETEYHWARKSPAGMWKVYRRGKLVTIFGKSLNLEPEQVAARLLNLDRQAHLTRTGGIW
jgi:hypothetical protein